MRNEDNWEIVLTNEQSLVKEIWEEVLLFDLFHLFIFQHHLQNGSQSAHLQYTNSQFFFLKKVKRAYEVKMFKLYLFWI